MIYALIFFSDDVNVIIIIYNTLSLLVDGPNDRIQTVVESGVCQRLSEFLRLSTEKDLVTPALRAVGNILTGDDMQTQVLHAQL